MTGAGAINILADVVFTVQGTTGGDDGSKTRTPAGSPLTIFCDRVRTTLGRALADHSTAQDASEFNRMTKFNQSIEVETKLELKANAPLMALLASTNGVVVEFTATADGCSIEGVGIVENIAPEYAGPSTLSFTIRQYGSPFVVSAA